MAKGPGIHEGMSDWATVKVAAARVDRTIVTVYEWLKRPEKVTGIRRMRLKATTYVHLPSLLDYEATVKNGRPPKS